MDIKTIYKFILKILIGTNVNLNERKQKKEIVWDKEIIFDHTFYSFTFESDNSSSRIIVNEKSILNHPNNLEI